MFVSLFFNFQVSQDYDVTCALVPPQWTLNLLYNFILEKWLSIRNIPEEHAIGSFDFARLTH